MYRYDTILWDVDQTLLDFKSSEAWALRTCFEQLGLKIDDEIISLYSQINNGFWKRLELGEITKEEVLQGRFLRLFEELGIADIRAEDIASRYQKALGEVYFYRDDSLLLCKKLKGKVRQYIVTNGVASTQRNKLNLSGLSDVMDGIFISEELGAVKPDIRFFEACFLRIPDLQREKTIIVGDSLSSDMKGGNNAKIICCWYNPYGAFPDREIKIDHEIKNLWEIEEIISCQNPQIKN